MPVTRSTGSGAATSGGVSFQHRVGAYYGALILAGEIRVPGLGTDVAATQLWLETDEPLDDVKIVDALGVSLLIQAKRTLDAGVGAKTEFAKVCDQLVRAHRQSAADSRFSIVVGRETGHPIATRLAAVLQRAQAQPSTAAPRHLAPSKDEKKIYDRLLAHLRRAARNLGQSADTAELRAILRRSEVRVLDLEPGGESEHYAIRALERDVVLDPGQASAAWSALLEASAELARTRSHSDRAGLQEVLRRKRIALREPPDLRQEIAALRQQSAESLKLLASRSAIALRGGAQLKIDREAASALAQRASRGSLALVGDAGAGKSACTYEALRQLHADGVEVIVIAAELIEAHSDVALGRELRINRPLHELLEAWPVDRGALVIDGLDAARDDMTKHVLVRLIEHVTGGDSRFHVLASLRTFDLRNSLRLARLLPAHEGRDDEYRRSEFAAIEHFWVPELTGDELAQLATRAPPLHVVLQGATPAVRELAALPFNLELLAELVLGAGLGADQLELLDTQVSLLEAYWRVRVRGTVDGDDREHLLGRACDAMVAARRLYADRRELQGPSNDALRALLHDHVLVEDMAQGRETVAFAHNLLYDHAVARSIFRVSDDQLLERLKAEPGLLISARPSLELHFRWLWEADARRDCFWSAALNVGGPLGLRPIGKTIAPVVAVDLTRSQPDMAMLFDALGDTDSARTQNAEEVLRMVVSAAMVVPSAQLARLGATWPAIALEATKLVRSSFAHSVKALIHHQLKVDSARSRPELGDAARRLLRFAWDQPVRNVLLIRAGILAVLETFSTDAAASEALLRKAIQPEHLASYGHEELPTVLSEVRQLIRSAPLFLADCYVAVFGYQETSNEPTSMHASRIMPLASNKRQDYDHARWELSEALPPFLEAAPREATRALIAIAAAQATTRGHVTTPSLVRVRWRGKVHHVYPDGSYIWDSSVHDVERKALSEFDQRLEVRATSDGAYLERVFGALADQPVPASVLAHIFRAATRAPDAFPQLPELLTKPTVLAMIDLQFPAGEYLAAVFPRLAAAMRQRIETALTRLPAEWPVDRREIGVRVRDMFVVALDAGAIVTPAVKRRHAELVAQRAPGPRPPFQIVTEWTEEESTLARLISDRGADPGREANRLLLDVIQPLKAFADSHMNSIPTSEEVRSVTPALKRAARALDNRTQSVAERAAVDEANTQLATVAELFSRSPRQLTTGQGRLVTDILLAASEKPSWSTRRRGDQVESWSPSPRISAAQGLPQLAHDRRFARPDIVAAIERLARDRAPEVRFQIAWRLSAMLTTAPETAWHLAHSFARLEPSGSVLEALAQTVPALLRADAARALELAERVLRREQRRKAPRTALLDNFSVLLVTHHVWEGSAPGVRVAERLASEASSVPDRARQLLHVLRDALYHGPASDDDEPISAAVRARGLAVVRLFLRASLDGLDHLRAQHGDTFNHAMTDSATNELRGWLQVAGGVADQLYFASGVFQVEHPSDQDRHADLAQRERLYNEGHDLLADLAGMGEPRAMHHLVEMLEGCIEFNPADVFLLIAEAVRSSASWGYQFEAMGEALVVRIVKHYITERRELFQHAPELEAALADVLDIFVDAGSPEAARLVYGLSELFR